MVRKDSSGFARNPVVRHGHAGEPVARWYGAAIVTGRSQVRASVGTTGELSLRELTFLC